VVIAVFAFCAASGENFILPNAMIVLLGFIVAVVVVNAGNCSWSSISGSPQYPYVVVVGLCNGRPAMARSITSGLEFHLEHTLANATFEPLAVVESYYATVVTGRARNASANRIPYATSALRDGTDCDGLGATQCSMSLSACYNVAQNNATVECGCLTDYIKCLGSCPIRLQQQQSCNSSYNYYQYTCDCGLGSKSVVMRL
jgi:hypothetical protein